LNVLLQMGKCTPGWELLVYIMGGQLVFDWARLENFLITHDQPVCNKVTNTTCLI